MFSNRAVYIFTLICSILYPIPSVNRFSMIKGHPVVRLTQKPMDPIIATEPLKPSLGFVRVLGSPFPFSRNRFLSWPPKRCRVLLVPHELHSRRCSHRIRVLCEVCLRVDFFRQEYQSGGPRGKLVHSHGVSFDPITEEIVNVFPRCCRLEGPGASVRS